MIAESASELRFLKIKVWDWWESQDRIYDTEINQIETIFGTSVIRVKKSNDGKGSSGKSTEPSRDFNFVNKLSLKWFWNKMKGFVIETRIW